MTTDSKALNGKTFLSNSHEIFILLMLKVKSTRRVHAPLYNFFNLDTVPTVRRAGCRKPCLHRDSIPELSGPYGQCTDYTVPGPFLNTSISTVLKKYNSSFKVQENLLQIQLLEAL